MLRQWYRIDPQLLGQASKPSADNDTLLQTDSENEVLLETESEAGSTHWRPLSEDEGDDILLQSDSEGESFQQQPCKKRKYSKRDSSDHLCFLEKVVCKHAHARLYGVGARALQNLREGRAAYYTGEQRLNEPKHPTIGVSLARDAGSHKWPNIMAFFWLLYSSCAEILPTKLAMPHEGQFESYAAKDPNFQERYVHKFMRNLEQNYDHNSVS